MDASLRHRAIRRIDDPLAARMVTDPTARRYLEPLLGRERSASELACELGVAVSTALYRLTRFIEAGLVEITRIARRGGRPIRHYRCVAEGFFVPFGATSLETAELLSTEVFRPWHDLLAINIGRAWLEASGDAPRFGFRVAVDDRGVVQRDIVPDEAPASASADPRQFFDGLLTYEAPAVWDTWATLTLMPDDAKDLQRAIARLLEPYRQRQRPGGRRHVVRLAMAAVMEEP